MVVLLSDLLKNKDKHARRTQLQARKDICNMKAGKVFIWMNLLGFDRNDPDKGVRRFLDQTGFVPDGVAALMFHLDLVHLHRGMEEEYELFPDNCAYYGIPRNTERERQPWTNHDLRNLADELKKNGSGLYASFMGTTMNNLFHREWYNEHPEILNHGRFGAENAKNHFVLKRFKDGTYYEDFFADKLCQVLQDYHLEGVHLADNFCPSRANLLYLHEYSTDFVDQFLTYSGAVLPFEIASTMGDDSKEAEEKRSAWIYAHLREELIEFHTWRWERFFQKLCARVHAIGKKVMVLGMYCTDPFETRYCLGIDLRRLVKSGVDYITANVLPTSCYLIGKDDRPYYFHRYMAIVSTTAAHLPKGHLLSMLGLQDATEEWSAMNHAPCLHEKDMYTTMAYQLVDGDGTSRALEGYYLCLGDGIPQEDWDWERERLEVALSSGCRRVISPAMLWSDYAYENMLHEYIHTRRWTPFKLFYELAKEGVHPAAAVTPEGLINYEGTLIVPNFDMISAEEMAAVTSYDKGSVFCTASPDFEPEDYGLNPTICINDCFSDYPMKAFVLRHEISDIVKATVAQLLTEDDGTPNLEMPVENAREHEYTLIDTLVFAKVTTGFKKAMALLLNNIQDLPFEIDKPNLILEMPDGAYRVYLFNDSMVKYHRAFVKTERQIKEVKIISKFPVLPPRFTESNTGGTQHAYTGEPEIKKSFAIRIQPGGVTILDIYLNN